MFFKKLDQKIWLYLVISEWGGSYSGIIIIIIIINNANNFVIFIFGFLFYYYFFTIFVASASRMSIHN